MLMQTQEQEHIRDMPLRMKSEETLRAAKKSRRGNPYEGAPLYVSGKLASHIKQSFGINANELAIRESPEIAEMGARATAQGNAIRFAPGEFKPDTREGMQVLGHELAHVREQATGGVHAPEGELFEHLRHEAASDRAGEAFAGGGLSAAAPVSVGGMSAEAAPIQGSLRKGIKNKFYNLMGATGWGRNKLAEKAKSSVDNKMNDKMGQIKRAELAPAHGMSEDEVALLERMGYFGKRIKDEGAHMDSYKFRNEEYSSDQRRTAERAQLTARDWSQFHQTIPDRFNESSAYHAVDRTHGNAYQRAKSEYADRRENEVLNTANQSLAQAGETYAGELHTTDQVEGNTTAQALRNMRKYREAVESGKDPGAVLYRAHDNDTPATLPTDPDYFYKGTSDTSTPEQMAELRQRRHKHLEMLKYYSSIPAAPDIDVGEEISSENASLSEEDRETYEMEHNIERYIDATGRIDATNDAMKNLTRRHVVTEPAPQRQHAFEQEMPQPQYAASSHMAPGALAVPRAERNEDFGSMVAESVRLTGVDTKLEYMPEAKEARYSAAPSPKERMNMPDSQGPVGTNEQTGQIDNKPGPQKKKKWWQFWK